MIQSLYYKEWLKLRWLLLIVLLSFAGVLLYSFMSLSQDLRVGGVNQVWDLIVQKGITYFGYLKYLPLVAGILLAISQYVPEMSNKRLKLTLHLPLSESKIMLTMLSYGVANLFVIFSVMFAGVYLGARIYFPTEIAYWNMIVTLPWFIGGIVAYLLTAWICLEPVWKQRIFNSLISILIVALYYFDAMPEAYCPSLAYLLIIAVLSISFSFYSLIRFKDGAQF